MTKVATRSVTMLVNVAHYNQPLNETLTYHSTVQLCKHPGFSFLKEELRLLLEIQDREPICVSVLIFINLTPWTLHSGSTKLFLMPFVPCPYLHSALLSLIFLQALWGQFFEKPSLTFQGSLNIMSMVCFHSNQHFPLTLTQFCMEVRSCS